MSTLTMTLPVLPGKTELWQRFCQELRGERKEAYEASRQRLGILRERFALVETSIGAAVLMHVEAHDVGRALARLAASEHPFDRWYRAKLGEMHGFWLNHQIAATDTSQPSAPGFAWSSKQNRYSRTPGSKR